MGKYPPKRCPNCGSENIHNQELESGSEYSELYDTYCRDCEWSGDISPDLPLDGKSPRGKTKKSGSSIQEEEISPKEIEELKALKHESEQGECVPLEEVLKKHGVKKRA